jgi:acetyl esterase/lipase
LAGEAGYGVVLGCLFARCKSAQGRACVAAECNARSAKGLPPALVITAENDVLRDEGEAYARKLTAAGVTVTSTRYNGTIHDFVMLNALANTPAARAAIAQANAFLLNVFVRS